MNNTTEMRKGLETLRNQSYELVQVRLELIRLAKSMRQNSEMASSLEELDDAIDNIYCATKQLGEAHSYLLEVFATAEYLEDRRPVDIN